jgi:hypothetical protein
MSNWKIRYTEAHYKHTIERTPSVVKDGHYSPPNIPKVNTANGLTLFICNYINWMGYRATRISTTGRQVGGRWIYGTTRKGTADIGATIKGRAVQIEIKVGNDKASVYQLQEQEKERKSGGIYEFISTPEQFFELFDRVVNN